MSVELINAVVAGFRADAEIMQKPYADAARLRSEKAELARRINAAQLLIEDAACLCVAGDLCPRCRCLAILTGDL